MWKLKSTKREKKPRYEVRVAMTREEVRACVEEALKQEVVGIDTETTGCDPKKFSPVGNAKCVAVQIGWGDVAYFIPTFKVEGVCDFSHLLEELVPLVEGNKKCLVLANGKYDMHVFKNHGIQMSESAFLGDTQVASFTENNGHQLHNLKELAKRWCGEDTQDAGFSKTFRVPVINKNGKPGKKMRGVDLSEAITADFSDFYKERLFNFTSKVHGQKEGAARIAAAVPGLSLAGLELLIAYSALDPIYTAKVYYKLRDALKQKKWTGDKNLFDFYELIEVPFTITLYNIERRGVPIDKAKLLEAKAKCQADIEATLTEFYRLAVKAGAPVERMKKFDLGNKTDIPWLFSEILGVKAAQKKRANGNITDTWDATALENIKNKKAQPLVECLLKYRNSCKLLSTYIEPFLWCHENYNGLMHTNLKQSSVVTGRLSCVAEWTPVLTQDGLREMKDVQVGDMVWTHRQRWREVLATYNKGPDMMYDVRLVNGNVLTCTALHRLLLQDGRWVSVGELLENASVESVDSGQGQSARSSPSVPYDGLAKHSSSCNEDEYVNAQRSLRSSQISISGRAEGSGGDAQIGRQDGRQESYERKDRGGAPQLDRRVRGREGLLDLSARREAAVRSSSSDGPSFGPQGAAAQVGGASHRRRPEEQQPGQPGASYASGTSRYPLLAGERLEGVEVEKITPRGICTVLDISVDEDESYSSAGIISHNSSAPNLQTAPKANKDPYGLRYCFVASETDRDMVMGDIDLAQVEIRLAAHVTQDPALLEAIHNDWDIHALTATKVFPKVREFLGARSMSSEILKEVKEKFPDERQNSKTIVFGTLYGMGGKKYAEMTGATEQEGYAAIDAFFAGYPTMKKAINKIIGGARARGYVRTPLRRYVYVDGINSEMTKVRMAAERLAFNIVLQGGCGEMMRMTMNLIDRDPTLNKLGVFIRLQVHDELLLTGKRKKMIMAKPLVEKYMSRPFECYGFKPLSVQTPADMGTSTCWALAKSLHMQTRDFSDLKPGYQVVYADPPWLYYGDPNKDQAAGKHYQMMSPEELQVLPVRDILAKKAVVLMWTTSSKMAEAIELLKAWGCFYRGVFQVWVKTSKSGNIIHGQGARPSFTKPTAEYLLVGSTQAKGKTLPIFSEKMPNVVLSERPENVHSRKPAVFRSNIEKLFGEVRRVELFARESPAGWDAWGNEVPLKTLKLKAKK